MPSSISSYNDAVKTAFSSLTDGYINWTNLRNNIPNL
jgi:hypothetical protein